MAGVQAVFHQSRPTYEVAESVVGGQMVAPTSGSASTVSVAAADSQTVLGVALKDARPATGAEEGTTDYGVFDLDVSYPQPYTPVADTGIFRLMYAADANFGALLKVGASGQVTPATVGVDAPAEIVAQCVEPSGASSGATGLTRLKLT